MLATISEVRVDGLVLRLRDSPEGTKDAWLPCDEWSANPLDWEQATLSLDRNYEFDVISLSRLKEGRLVVSRKSIDSKTINDSLTGRMPVRDMTVQDVGRRLIRGTIGSDIPAIITGRNYQTYLDWVSAKALTQELSDHAVLGKGDFVRGFVKGVDYGDIPASLIFDVGEYLDFRSTEIASIVISPSAAQETQQEPIGPGRRLQKGYVQKISPVLLADDNECRDSIAKVLRREGLEVHTLESADQAQEFLDLLSTDEPRPVAQCPRFRLAILDPNLKEDSNDLVGLRIAAKLRAKLDCRVIVMTGEAKSTNKIQQWPDLGIHGYIEKPFTMDQLIGEIEDAVGLTKALPLKMWIEPQDKDSLSPKRAGSLLESSGPEISIAKELQLLGRLKPGAVIHVFELHPRSYRARSLGSFAGAILKWEALRGKIAKSVIRDSAMGSSLILDANASRDDAKHLWTLEMMRYQSFCGLPIHVEGKKVALVAFHPERNAFDGSFVGAARLIAERVGRAIERDVLYHTRRNEADLASFGMALAALAHELASEMTGLNANLKDLGDLVSDNKDDNTKRSEALGTLEKVRRNVDVITKKARILRRTHVSSDRVSLIEAMKKASTACVTVIGETIKQPERILIKEFEVPTGKWEVSASMASLLIVFFNLYLNAAQQIDLASPVRRDGVISSSLTRFKDAKGRVWARARVHDSGPGIHRDDWERVFEPGYSTKPDGSGLGLYICRYLLRDCSASIAVTSSAIWDGTTVTVNIPLAD